MPVSVLTEPDDKFFPLLPILCSVIQSINIGSSNILSNMFVILLYSFKHEIHKTCLDYNMKSFPITAHFS